MGFMLEPSGENIQLVITAKEGFEATICPNGDIILTGSKDAWLGLTELLMGEFETEEE